MYATDLGICHYQRSGADFHASPSLYPHLCRHMRLQHGGWGAKYSATKLLLNVNVCQCPAGSYWEGFYRRKVDTNGSPPHMQWDRPCLVGNLVYPRSPSDMSSYNFTCTLLTAAFTLVECKTILLVPYAVPNIPAEQERANRESQKLIASTSSVSWARALQAVFPTCLVFLPSLQKCPWGVQHGDQRHLLPQDPCIR